ncbi:MAG: flagellar basal body-associated FliL family protein [Gemmobacter sp.]
MRALVLPLVLAIAGAGAGIGAGLYLRAPPDPDAPARAPAPAVPKDYIRFANQFVVPVIEGGRIAALVILSLSIEVDAGKGDAVYAREPKLRDAFLEVLFQHANTGGFAGTFTDGSALVGLRQALREAAARIIGPAASDVLVVDLVRQDS